LIHVSIACNYSSDKQNKGGCEQLLSKRVEDLFCHPGQDFCLKEPLFVTCKSIIVFVPIEHVSVHFQIDFIAIGVVGGI